MASKRIMVDLETLSDDVHSAIVSLGACTFNYHKDTIGNEFHLIVDISSQEHRTVNPNTLKWWVGKNLDNIGLLADKSAVDIEDALYDFKEWIFDVGGCKEMWANSPSFDLNIIKDANAMYGVKNAWGFYNERDYRTMYNMFKDSVDLSMIENQNAHSALDDAIYQAEVLNQILRSVL